MNNIYGQILALFKSLKFEEPTRIYGSTPILSLPTFGTHELFRVQLRSVWHEKKTYYFLNNIISFLKVNKETKLLSSGLQNKELEELVLGIISKEALRCDYLNCDDVFLGRKGNLLECTSKQNPKEAAKWFFQQIKFILHREQTNWLNIVPLMNLSIDSFNFEEDGISIIKRGDKDFWTNLSSEFKTSVDFNIDKLSLDKNTVSMHNNIIIVCQSFGLKAYSKLDSELKIRKFLSILFSFLIIDEDIKLFKSMYKEESMCFQLPSDTINNTITVSNLTNILPHYINNFKDINIQKVKEYYKKLTSRNEKIQRRVTTSANYINRAMNSSNDTDSFINYYIALDALFGVKGNVGKSIRLGIETITSDRSIQEKATYLYDLRNELIHGGCRFIEEWESFEEYYNKFKTEILNDIEELTFFCLREYPFKIDNDYF